MAVRHIARRRAAPNPYHLWAQRLAAAAVVVALHLALVSLLLRATGVGLSAAAPVDRSSVRWLPPPAAEVVPQRPATATPTQARTSPVRPSNARSAAALQPQTTQVTTAAPGRPAAATPTVTAVQPPTAALDLRLPAGAVAGGDGIDAVTVQRRLIGRRAVHPAFLERPPRFRMRPQMSPEQVLQGIGQFLGFWPPGYKVDPCELAKQDAQYFEGAVEAYDREQLKVAWMTISARCR